MPRTHSLHLLDPSRTADADAMNEYDGDHRTSKHNAPLRCTVPIRSNTTQRCVVFLDGFWPLATFSVPLSIFGFGAAVIAVLVIAAHIALAL
ncbi:hypothetical protein [Nonomuraea sp. NPDC049480]|uniref:hypothetical protein n=1 Tax=Nonomuraea sp. NPDC049480 TaxID=3364353 RepID=UPI0037BC5B8E